MGLGPFDLPGSAFLVLYAGLLIITIIAGTIIPRWLRPTGRTMPETDPDHLAYLAGGAVRMAECLVAGLLAAGALVMEGRNRFRIVRETGVASPAQCAILALSSPAPWPAIAAAANRPAASIEAHLVRSGLMVGPGGTWQLRFWQTMPYLLLIAFGLTKWLIGVGRDRPVGVLTGLLLFTAILALIRFWTIDRRTRGGMAAIKAARRRADRLRRAPTPSEAGLAVALFGTTVLAGSAWSDFHRLRSASGGDGGNSGDSGSSDGGGCSGGGCGGGCGGCGS
ncbi:TIGR04222 domain-containing membrane protein [Sphingomonas sp. 28-63-12]|uniref:TIGR04222 domain-containing membrane protein n=1 Tax=Sphingomonas sp. 28-63-12 TaxID=1970434 RepID=UPI0035A83123